MIWVILFIWVLWIFSFIVMNGGGDLWSRIPDYFSNWETALSCCCDNLERLFGFNGQKLQGFVIQQITVFTDNFQTNIMPVIMGKSVTYMKGMISCFAFFAVVFIAVMLLVKDYGEIAQKLEAPGIPGNSGGIPEGSGLSENVSEGAINHSAYHQRLMCSYLKSDRHERSGFLWIPDRFYGYAALYRNGNYAASSRSNLLFYRRILESNCLHRAVWIVRADPRNARTTADWGQGWNLADLEFCFPCLRESICSVLQE